MAAKVYYQGLRRGATILDYQTRGGETYAIALIDGFKVEKWVHATSIIQANSVV